MVRYCAAATQNIVQLDLKKKKKTKRKLMVPVETHVLHALKETSLCEGETPRCLTDDKGVNY